MKKTLMAGITGQGGAYLTDSTNLIRIIQEVQPDEIYNLGAMSHIHLSFETPEYRANTW